MMPAATPKLNKSSTASKSIGFIGLGNMGAPMALNVLRAYGSLEVFDLDPRRVELLTTAGASGAPDIHTLCRNADIVITSLPGPPQVQAVADGDRGLLRSLKPGSVWIDMTTNDPGLVRRLEEMVKERGSAMLEAPVTGAVDGARLGRLTIFVGGDRTLYEQQLWILGALGSAVLHCGGIGTGNITKLVTNQLWFINAAAIGEALVLGVRGGVDLQCLWKAIKTSVGSSFVAEHDVPSIFAGHYDPSFSLDLCMKDLDLIRALGVSTNVPLEMTQCARARFECARAAYGGAAGELHVAKLIEDATGTYLRCEGAWPPPWQA